MLYKQFSKITDAGLKDFAEEFDYWLGTLPVKRQKNITISLVSSIFDIQYKVAEKILEFCEKEKILKKYYLVECPNADCESILKEITFDEIASVLIEKQYCGQCDEYKKITLENIYSVYSRIQKPDVSDEELEKEILKRLPSSKEENFNQADLLLDNKATLYEVFYKPSESAYKKFKELKDKLDLEYGNNTTAKGKALEVLILEIFNQIKYVNGTNDIKTQTNQFDCTLFCNINTIYLSIFNYLHPVFIVECKNEKKKPDNSYTNKLESIMQSNNAQIGIIFGRKDATKTCFAISREHYLINKNSSKQQIIITCCDKDLDYIIDKRVNLLKYLEYKIYQITINSSSMSFEMYEESF